MNDKNYLKYYALEDYLFDEVAKCYQQTKSVSTFDFFCIVIWKANRAKSKIAKHLLNPTRSGYSYATLDEAVQALIQAISAACDAKERMRVLIVEWGFRLPMASAILTVLFQDDFTIYDVRVRQMLNDFKDVQNKEFDDLWKGYEEYTSQVKAATDGQRTLRDTIVGFGENPLQINLRRTLKRLSA